MTHTEDSSNLILTLSEEVELKLQIEADKQHKSLNEYIVWLLMNRPKKEKSE